MSTLERSPQAIGDYSLLHELDPAGGMGRRAYLALRRTVPGSQRLYVVKLLDLEGSARTKAMQQMARAKELDHPAIAPLTESLDHEGSLVAVFEHFEGLRLDQIQQHLERAQERLSDLAIWHIAHQVLGALECAHGAKDERGRPLQLVHGNLGPDRVHISWDGEVRVFGVGVPSVFDDTHRSDFALAFRAPERRQGMASGPQSDVYSAAAILWSLLTGQTPSTDGGQLAKLGTLRTDLPAKATTILDSALERSWTRRKVTCQHLDDALARAFERIDDASELRWNMEVFRALSVFSQSQAPPPVALPEDPTALPSGIAQTRRETTDEPAESLAETRPRTGAKPRPAPRELLPRREAPTVPRARTEPRPAPQERVPRREAPTVPRVWVGGPSAGAGGGGKKLRASTVLGVGPGNLREELEKAEDALVAGLGKPADEPKGGAAETPAPAATKASPTKDRRKALASVPIIRIPVSAKKAEEMRQRGAQSDDYRPTVPVAKPSPTVGRDEAHDRAESPRIGLLGLRSQQSAAPPRRDRPSSAEERGGRRADQPADAPTTTPPRADEPLQAKPAAEPADADIEVLSVEASDLELSAQDIALIAADQAGVEDLLGVGDSEPPAQVDLVDSEVDVAPGEPAAGTDEPEAPPSTPPPISFPPPRPRKSEPTAAAGAAAGATREASPAAPAAAPHGMPPQPPTPEPAHPEPPVPAPTATRPAPRPPAAPETATGDPAAPAAAAPPPVESPAAPPAPPSPAPAPRRGLSPAVALTGMVLIAAVAFAAAWFLRPILESTTDRMAAAPTADGPSAAAPTAAPDPTGTASPPPGDPSAESESTATEASSAAPEPSADAAAEERETIDGLPPIQDDIPAGDKLLSYQGYLIVRSRAKADVYVQGKQVGPTNTKNKTSCWTRHVKLRDPATQKWLTPGQPVRIVCMETTTVTISP